MPGSEQGPEDTPYQAGCYIFDIYFPPQVTLYPVLENPVHSPDQSLSIDDPT